MIKNISIYNIVPKSTNAVKNIVGIAKTQQQQLTQGVKEGVEKGKRLSSIQQRGTIKTAQAKLIGIKRALPQELWYGFLGTLAPLPGGTIMGIGLGRLIKLLKK